MKGRVVSVTPVIDTAIFATADGMCAAFEIPNAFNVAGGLAELVSVAVIDRDKEKAAFDIFLFDALPTIASAVNATLDITDAIMAASFVGTVVIAAADFADLSGSAVQTKQLTMKLQAAAQKTSLWGVLVSRGTGTYTAATDLCLKFGFRH